LPDAAARQVEQVVRTAKRATENLQRWATDRTAPAIKIINGTGTLFTERAEAYPVCAEVAMAWSAVAGSWCEAEGSLDGVPRAERVARGKAHELTGFSARIAATWPGGVIAATKVAQASARRLTAESSQPTEKNESRVHIPRWAARTIGSAGPLPDVLRAVGIEVEEFGAVASPNQSKLLPNELTGTVVVWSNGCEKELASMQLAQANHCIKVVVAPYVWPGDPLIDELGDPLTVNRMFELGADLVVASGNHLFGGPSCGILFAADSHLTQAERCSLWPSLRADAATHASMAAAFEIWSEGGALRRMPMLVPLALRMENLHHRANQLKTRLATVDGLGIEEGSGFLQLWEDGPTIPSVKLTLRKPGVSGLAWAESLQRSVPALWSEADESSLTIDLRAIDPALESALCELLGGH
jgi:L-seryl-tRNA(Ser) seleniumtransferase